MANIVFASNNIAHFPGSVAGSVVGTFDATRVPYTLALTNYGIYTSPKFKPVTGDVTWFHFRTYFGSHNSNISAANPNVMFQCFDAANNLLFKIGKRTGVDAPYTTSTLYNGTTSIILNNSIPLMESKLNSVDIKITVNSLLIKAEIFINGAPAGEVSFGTNPNVLTKPNRMSLGTAFVNSLTSIQHYSEILVSDGDTRNARLNLLRPVAAGALSEWDGSLATIADDDTATGMTTTEPDKRQTMVLSPYVGAANISNFVATSMTTRGQNSPTKLRHTVRLSGVNYDSADMPLANGLEYNLTDYKLNPATSLPWVSSDLSAIETGFLSVA